MTRKDYLMIAEALRQARDETNFSDQQAAKREQHQWDCACIAGAMKRDNPTFNEDLFFKNAGAMP